LQLIKIFYEKIFKTVVPVSSLETAEMVKIFENTFRLINISLVNELKEYTDTIGIDMWEVINAAASKPFGFMPHYPSPGVGGHCIPVDPFYLYNDAEKKGIRIDMIHTAGVINDKQPVRVVEHTLQIMDKNTQEMYTKKNTEESISLTPQLFSPHFYKNPMTMQGIKGGSQYVQVTDIEKRKYKILLIGITYKPDIDDIRESAALKIWNLFEEKGHVVSYHDPYVDSIRDTTSLPLTEELLEGQDIFVIVTNHQNIDYTYLTTFNKPIVDTRHVYKQKLPNIYYV
ncbi:MAG TPA: UDP binding domain-containing protein, partial [Clostridia bacterium]